MVLISCRQLHFRLPGACLATGLFLTTCMEDEEVDTSTQASTLGSPQGSGFLKQSEHNLVLCAASTVAPNGLSKTF